MNTLSYFIGSYIALSLLPSSGSMAKDDWHLKRRAAQMKADKLYSLSELASLWRVSELKASQTAWVMKKKGFIWENGNHPPLYVKTNI